jgi:hypothetical protein
MVVDRTLPRRAGLLGALLLSSGCFSYVPGDLRNISPEHEVRLELTRVGFAQLPEIPNHPGPDLSGMVVRQEASQLWLRVPVAIRADGMVTGTVQQDVVIPQGDILKIEQRVFSKRRTAVVAAGGVGVLVGLIAAFGSGGPPVGEEPPKPIDEEAGSGSRAVVASIPILSILFR